MGALRLVSIRRPACQGEPDVQCDHGGTGRLPDTTDQPGPGKRTRPYATCSDSYGHIGERIERDGCKSEYDELQANPTSCRIHELRNEGQEKRRRFSIERLD